MDKISQIKNYIHKHLETHDEFIVTKQFLINNPECIFVFGDNTQRKGKGGAAKLRDCDNAYGFITKKYPNNCNSSFYKPNEYLPVYEHEINIVRAWATTHKHKLFLISKLGADLANRYGIFEQVIAPNIRNDLSGFDNVVFLWKK